ncbi:LysR family transcriptional regulator [Crocosphaera sp.]|uniref:LysR family transcriptional regulator n=1 Tax=Crocosphaera sp. TaxID=2729996 RepID=UPI003F20C1B7|nr:LysR family transcriptional regulator [Crocosphaera sp.]
MDKLESMYAFTRVVEEGSFAAAARKMELSRSAVNKLVINLENYLGVSLLYRTTRQVTPTATGQAFYERCLDILNTVEEAELSVSQQQREPQGHLKINAPMSFGVSGLGRVITEFMSCHSKLKVQLTLEDRLIDPISEGYDLVIRIGSPPTSPNLIVHKITTISRVICASPHYLKMKGMPQTIQDLKDHSCLHYGYLLSGGQWRLIHQEKEEKIFVEGVFCSNNGEALRDAALQGLGIVMLPTFIIENFLKNGDLTRVLSEYQPPELELLIIYPVNRHLSPKIQLLTQFLKDHFQ